MSKYDVFLSWTGEDRVLKDEIRDYLESRGLSCYDSDRDCKGDYAEDFALSLEESQVYLLLLTPSLFRDPNRTPGKRFSLVRKELRYAGDLEAQGKINFVIVSSLVFNAPGEEEIERFYAAHTAGFNKISLSQGKEKAFASAYAQAKDFVLAREKGKPIPSVSPRLPILVNHLVGPSSFVGREKELSLVEEAFDQGARIVVLSGEGGVGKTSIATEFAATSPFLAPQEIVYVDEEIPTLENFVLMVKYPHAVYEALTGLPSSQRSAYCLAYLKDLKEDVMLLLDNVNALTPKFLRQLKAELSCKFLLTTRRDLSSFPQEEGIAYLSIGALPLEKTKEVFQSHYGPLSEEEERIYEESIYDPYSGNTQAIVLTGKMLHEQGISLSDFRLRREEFLRRDYVSHEMHGEYRFETVSSALADFFRITAFLSVGERKREILAFLSGLRAFGIKESKLKEILGLPSSNDLIELWKNGLVNRELRKQGYYLSMHSVVAEALNLNGVYPTPSHIASIKAFLQERLDDEEDVFSSDTLEAFYPLLKLFDFKGDEEKKEKPMTYSVKGQGEESLDILDVLLDEDNVEPLALRDEEGNTLFFEQIAVIPHQDMVYCVLKPLSKIAGIAENEAVVFYVEEREDAPSALRVCADEATAIAVMKKYYRLLIK